ncbi:hypothetical protein N431DRAFT_529532 [Stipitochalara longipes BDJ]|nr:hypothetical protein N431DRAFT_529532 [Stipitochalara longipes BDJ]
MTSNLEPYDLSGAKRDMLEQVFSQFVPLPILEVYQKRPRPSVLRKRAMEDLSIRDLQMNRHSPAVMEAVLRSIQLSWDNFAEGSVAPNEFMRTPFGAMYKVVAVEGKGRGMIASRDIKADEIILQESPVLILPPGDANTILFLTLPQKALEAILLLHNAKPDNNRFTNADDIPVHRLLDLISGILDTNCFTGTASYGSVGVLLLRGALFNHSNTPNVCYTLDGTKEVSIFKAERDIKGGEELEIGYVPDDLSLAAKAERLKNYGL